MQPDYGDGKSDEDVSWMYMSVIDYIRYYNDLDERLVVRFVFAAADRPARMLLRRREHGNPEP